MVEKIILSNWNKQIGEYTMYLWVWEDVLEDYTYGIMFAVAPTVEEARELILLEAGNNYYKDMVNKDLLHEPKRYTLETKGAAHILPGGG